MWRVINLLGIHLKMLFFFFFNDKKCQFGYLEIFFILMILCQFLQKQLFKLLLK